MTPGVYFLDFFFFSASGAHNFEKLADFNVFRQCTKFFRRELVPALRAIGVVEFSEKYGAQVYNFAHGKKEADRPQESLRARPPSFEAIVRIIKPKPAITSSFSNLVPS